MLETVKSAIKDAPFISFEQYFVRYVMEVQDQNIDQEVSFLFRNNKMNMVLLNRLISTQLG